MNEIIKVGIVGCGNVFNVHAQSINEIEGAAVAAICGRTKEKVDKLAAKYNIKDVYTDYNELLKRDDIQIIDILTPTGLHEEIAIKAAQKGRHVLVEKPIEVNLYKGKRMIDACEKAGVKLGVIFQHRMDESIKILKNIIFEGKLGKLVLGDAHIKWFRDEEYYKSGSWRGTYKLDGGGVLMNQGIHTIDLLQYIMGDVYSVKAFAGTLNHDIEVEDTAAAAIKFKNGALGTIIGTTCAYPGLPASLEINGTKGSARIEGDKLIFVKAKNFDYDNECVTIETGCNNPMNFSHSSHKAQIKDMINAVKEDREPLVNGYEALKSLKIVLAIYESQKTGKEIMIK